MNNRITQKMKHTRHGRIPGLFAGLFLLLVVLLSVGHAERVLAEKDVTSWEEWQSWLADSKNINKTLVLTQDITAGDSDKPLKVDQGRTYTIDLNGHTINRGLQSGNNDGNAILVYGNLTVTVTVKE